MKFCLQPSDSLNFNSVPSHSLYLKVGRFFNGEKELERRKNGEKGRENGERYKKEDKIMGRL